MINENELKDIILWTELQHNRSHMLAKEYNEIKKRCIDAGILQKSYHEKFLWRIKCELSKATGFYNKTDSFMHEILKDLNELHCKAMEETDV